MLCRGSLQLIGLQRGNHVAGEGHDSEHGFKIGLRALELKDSLNGILINIYIYIYLFI